MSKSRLFQLALCACRGCLLSALVYLPCGKLPAQEVPLYLEQRYDELVLTDEYEQARIQVFPLPFTPDDIPRQSEVPLRIRLIDYPDREYDVAWKDIERIRFFEDALVADALQLINVGKFEEAYDVLRFVWKGTPDWRGLSAAINRFLLAEAGLAYRENHAEEAMVLLEQLFGRQPDARVASALTRVVDRAFSERFQANDFRGARQLIAWVSSRPQLPQQGKIAAWRRQMREAADRQLELATAAAARRDYRKAFASIDEALRILPDDPAAREVNASLLVEYSRVTVAVSRRAGARRTLDGDWARERIDRLTDRHLVELVGQGTEGGQFRSAYGQLDFDPDGVGLRLKLDGEPTAVVQEALQKTLDTTTGVRQLAAHRCLSRLLRSWEYRQNELHVRFADNTLRWLPLLDMPLGVPLLHWQPYVWDQPGGEGQPDCFLANPQGPHTTGQIAEICERKFSRQLDMIAAIESGDVDIVDRLLPAEAEQLASQDIHVRRYGLISMYFLVPNDRSALGRNRAFRRGVVRAIPRENILNLILSGRTYEGCDILSGPFHQGFDRSDPLAYAYNVKITPRPFDPALGATLIGMSWHLAELEAAAAAEAAADPAALPEVDGQPTTNAEVADGAAADGPGPTGPVTPQIPTGDSPKLVLVFADDAILASMAEQNLSQLAFGGGAM